MTTFSLDSSCMIAAVCAWHERHDDAAQAIHVRFDRGDRLAIAAHALVETYAVLTRLPAPHRLAPAVAWALIDANFVKHATVAMLTARGQVALLRRLAGENVSGGRSYDALIAETARRSGAGEILTLNPRHFESLAQGGVVIIDPSAAA